MEKMNIKIDPKLCSGCSCCQLICSLTYTGAFNPEKARIVPEMGASVSFTDDCITKCSLCTSYCSTGALERILDRVA